MGNTVKTKDSVETFLGQFVPKLDVWGIIFLGREKNLKTQLEFGINEEKRKDIIRNLGASDYVETIDDAASYGDMWVFGKTVNGVEMYIKVSLGKPNGKTICISFHKAEFPIKYAFKKL